MSLANVAEVMKPLSQAKPLGAVVTGVPLVLAAFGAAAILAMTRWGIGTSPDAISYIKAARYLAGDGGMGILLGYVAVELPLTITAPFYSLVLAGAGLSGIDPFDAARWVGAALFGLNLLLVAGLVRHVTFRASWLASLAALVMLGAAPMVTLHGSALSEPLFLFLTFSGFLLLALYVERGRALVLAAAAGCIGLAMLTRYAGAACVLTGAMGLLVVGRGRLGRRFLDALVFGSICGVPVLLWMARNIWVGATATGRELGFHPVDRSHAWQAFYTVSGWLQIPASASNGVRLAVWLVLGAAFAGLIRLAWRDRPRSRPTEGAAPHARIPPLVGMLVLFMVVYAAFLTISISLFDANTPLDDRILSPTYVAGLVLLAFVVDRLWPACAIRPALAAAMVLVAVGFATAQTARTAQLIVASHARGWGFSSLAWQQSPVLAAARGLPGDVIIFSNAPEVVYLHTGRDAVGLPKRWLPMSRRPNAAYSDEMSAMQARIAREPSVVVYLSAVAQGASMPLERDLRDAFSLRAWASAADGTILCGGGCPE